METPYTDALLAKQQQLPLSCTLHGCSMEGRKRRSTFAAIPDFWEGVGRLGLGGRGGRVEAITWASVIIALARVPA
jgi:hypothetical protein